MISISNQGKSNLVHFMASILLLYSLLAKLRFPNFIFTFDNAHYIIQLFLLIVTYFGASYVSKYIFGGLSDITALYLKKVLVWLALYSPLDFILKIDSSRILVISTMLVITFFDALQGKTAKTVILVLLLLANIFIYRDNIREVLPQDPNNQTVVATKCNEEMSGSEIYRLCQEIPNLREVNDLEAISMIRSYLHENLLIQSGVKDVQIQQRPNSIEGWINEYDGKNSGSLCGDLATALRDVYREFGLVAETYNFGHEPSTATHVVTLVNVAGQYYLQDPTFNYDVRDTKSNEQITIQTALERIVKIQLDEIYDSTLKPSSYRRILGESSVTKSEFTEFACQKLNEGLVLCNKYSPPRDLIHLDSDERYVKALIDANPTLAKEENPLKYLYLMLFPIGNQPQVNCEVLDQC